MFQLAGLLIFFGFGSVVLYYMDYEFKILSWLTEYQPVAGVVIGVAGLAVLVLAFWLKSREPGSREPGSDGQPAHGAAGTVAGARSGPPQQANHPFNVPGQPPAAPAGPYSAQPRGLPGQTPIPGQPGAPGPRPATPPQPQAPYPGNYSGPYSGPYVPPAQPANYPPPPYPNHQVNGTPQPTWQPPNGAPGNPPR